MPRHGGSVTHEDRMPAEHRGKRQWRPGNPAEERIQDPEAGPETVVTDEGRHEPSPPARPATNPQAPRTREQQSGQDVGAGHAAARGPAARRSRLAIASPRPASAGSDATTMSHPRWSSSRRKP